MKNSGQVNQRPWISGDTLTATDLNSIDFTSIFTKKDENKKNHIICYNSNGELITIEINELFANPVGVGFGGEK